MDKMFSLFSHLVSVRICLTTRLPRWWRSPPVDLMKLKMKNLKLYDIIQKILVSTLDSSSYWFMKMKRNFWHLVEVSWWQTVMDRCFYHCLLRRFCVKKKKKSHAYALYFSETCQWYQLWIKDVFELQKLAGKKTLALYRFVSFW